jgi:hypothetical protein
MNTARTAWLVLMLAAGGAHAAVTATLDSTTISPDDSVQLTLLIDRQTGESPDLAPLAQDFDVLSTSRTGSMQITNGRVSSQTQVVVTLAPKHDGQLVVPPLTWGSERSPQLTLTVSAGAKPGAAGGAAERVFLETIVDDKEPYVQSAVNVTVRVYAADHLYQAGLEFPGNDDVLVQQVGSDRNRSVEKNGQSYEAVERHYVLFPQRSGTLNLPGAVLAGQIAVRVMAAPFRTDPFADMFGGNSAMMGATKPFRVHGDPVVLEVKPRPASFTGAYWLPAQNLTVSGGWRPDGGELHVGDPITLDLQLRADGLTAAQLPDVAGLLHLPDGLKAYPDQPKLDNSAQGETVVGKRDQSIALIADRPGTYSIPDLRVSWWDTKARQPRETVFPGRTLKILPATGTAAVAAAPVGTPLDVAGAAPAAAPAAAGPARGGVSWMWVSAALAAVWLITLGIWWWSRRRPAPRAAARARTSSAGQGSSAGVARAEFQAACQRNDAHGARRALLAWAGAEWPEAPPAGTTAIAARLQDASVASLLQDLDRACYGGGAWNGAALAQALGRLPDGGTKTAKRGDGIAPLYR